MNYDDDPRYEFVEEGVYFDTQTNETVILLDEETSNAIRDLIILDDTVFEPIDDNNVRLTAEGAKKLFHVDSDLNDL